MSSRKIEDIHLTLLNKLLSDSGLECIRSAPESLESFSSLEEAEEEASHEQHEELISEETQEGEDKQLVVEEVQAEEPEVFPTPSLRRVIPEKIRKIEEQYRIHVLPEEFKTDIDPAAIPTIAHTAQQKYIDSLAEIVGCTEYKSSLAEFWFLDTLANLLRRAQEDELDRPTQAVLILWFCEWMKEIQHFDAADRKRMMRRFQDNMLSAAKFIAEEERIPTPTDAGIYYRAPEEIPEGQPLQNVPPEYTRHASVTFEGAAFECSLRDLTKIIHYIFDLFSTDYQYDLVRSIFTFSPEYTLIDVPYQIQNPKSLYAPLKFKPKKEKSPKSDKPGAKGKKKDIDTEEYLALLELKAKQERELQEQEERDREVWQYRSHILPLNLAADDAFFNKYWPPPPPEPVPEPELEPKGKGKGKGKK
ncbi:uncharacterized protein LOC131841291 [Achroia grisella]|uniref:uncharacterized protein LOC131841291 n=1 Tax=Achroia grisella TaxID=688607 RepID=UPI0027D31115|nr:uncharacterized protein LOC131841291 [Achroia grisella]